jgi:serine O-acetyltransferase
MTMKDSDLENLFTTKYKNKDVSLCRDTMETFGDSIIKLLFPAMCNHSAKTLDELKSRFKHLESELITILECIQDELHDELNVNDLTKEFFAGLMQIEKQLNLDAQYILAGDPAAKSLNEVIICYPGFYAIALYRIARFFQIKKVTLFPRILTEYAHRRTGIDIHPGASIKAPIFIDHGTGVVIGESAIIGENVKIYQGVTIGATSVDKSLANVKRHPTIEDNCIIYSNATILGGETTIGKNSIIGGNVWITNSVAANTHVFYKKSQTEKN